MEQRSFNWSIVDSFSHACTFGNEEVVDILLEYKIKKEKQGKTVFEVTKDLNSDLPSSGQTLQLNTKNAVMSNLLMKASCFGYLNIVWKLLKFGANPRYKNENGDTALSLACTQEHYEIWEKLIMAKADVNETDGMKRTPLLKATKHNTNTDIIELLLKNGAKTDIADEFGSTPLHYATIRGSDVVVEYLVKLGADSSHTKP